MTFKYLQGLNYQGGVWTLPGDDIYIVLGRPRKNQVPCSELSLLKNDDPKKPLRISTAPSLDASDILKQAEDLEKRTESLLRRMKGYR